MSAETLRRAAALMRERVEAVTPRRRPVGSFYPETALAVADWLDRVVENEPSWGYAGRALEAESALAVARAYLGDS